MKFGKALGTIVLAALTFGAAFAQEEESGVEFEGVEWIHGPRRVALGDLAEVEVPEGHVFAGVEGTQRLMELFENPVSGAELGFLAPESLDWFVVFESFRRLARHFWRGRGLPTFPITPAIGIRVHGSNRPMTGAER